MSLISEQAADVIYTVMSILVIISGIIAYWASGVREKYGDLRIATLQESTARANEGLAKSALEQERLRNANLQLSLKLEEEKRERAELIQATAPRVIAFEVFELQRIFGEFKDIKVTLLSIPEDEPIATAKELQRVFGTAGWDLQRGVLPPDQYAFPGISIEGARGIVDSPVWKAADAIIDFLKSQNIDANTRPTPTDDLVPENTMRITVGRRPHGYFFDMRLSPEELKRKREADQMHERRNEESKKSHKETRQAIEEYERSQIEPDDEPHE